MKEVWSDIPGYEGYYQVSNFGNVKSLARIVRSKKRMSGNNSRSIKEHLISFQYDVNGYVRVTLCKEAINKRVFVHRLVLYAFIGIRPLSIQCNHKDGNKLNNHLGNLEWCTSSENNQHAVKTGLKVTKKGAESPISKYSQQTRNEIVAHLNSGLSSRKVSALTGIPQRSIIKIKNRHYAQ